MSIIGELLNNQFVQGIIIAGAGWLVNKIVGAKKTTTAGRAASALAASAALMTQFALTEANKTPTEMIAAFKGIVAIQFARAGFTEAQRAPFQPMIDAAIAKAVTEWVKLHPTPSALTMPITAKVVPA